MSQKNRVTHLLLSVLLFLATAFTAMSRFGTSYPNFPESEKYLTMVEFFRGDASMSATVAPFNYRFLLPAIVSLIPLDPELSFSVINLALLFVLATIMYLIPREFGLGRFSSTCAALLCMVSHPVRQYGAVVLVEVPFMVCLALGVLGIVRGWRWRHIAVITAVGVLFKETTIIIALVYMPTEWRTGGGDWKKGLYVGLFAGPFHLATRLWLSASAGGSSWIWDFKLINLVGRPMESLEVVVLSLLFIGLPLLAALAMRNDDNDLFGRAEWALLWIALPLSGLGFVSFFFGFFSVRFLWPMYLGLLPMIGYGVQSMLEVFYSLEFEEYVEEVKK